MPGNDLYPLKENILPQESLLPQGRTEPRPYTDLGGYGGGINRSNSTLGIYRNHRNCSGASVSICSYTCRIKFS